MGGYTWLDLYASLLFFRLTLTIVSPPPPSSISRWVCLLSLLPFFACTGIFLSSIPPSIARFHGQRKKTHHFTANRTTADWKTKWKISSIDVYDYYYWYSQTTIWHVDDAFDYFANRRDGTRRSTTSLALITIAKDSILLEIASNSHFLSIIMKYIFVSLSLAFP